MIYEHDPDVPAGFQEADILQAQYEAEGRRLAELHRRGVCTHGWMLGRGNIDRSRDDIDAEHRRAGRFPDRPLDPRVTCQSAIPQGQCVCLDCGELIPDPLEAHR